MEQQVSEDELIREYSSSRLEVKIPQKLREQIKPYLIMKRIIDISLSAILLIPALLFIFIFGILIKLESPGSIFYKQERVGLNGKTFNIIKLRSMRNDAEKNGAKWAVINDPRVTKVGAFIRKTRIDELPQLFNVLVGQMSMIGPRPERPVFTAQFNEEIPGFVNRLAVKPGITGWAQVHGGYEITPKEKLNLDLYYIKNVSFMMEVKVFFKTIKIVCTGDGAR